MTNLKYYETVTGRGSKPCHISMPCHYRGPPPPIQFWLIYTQPSRSAEHQTTNLGVGSSNLSGRAKKLSIKSALFKSSENLPCRLHGNCTAKPWLAGPSAYCRCGRSVALAATALNRDAALNGSLDSKSRATSHTVISCCARLFRRRERQSVMLMTLLLIVACIVAGNIVHHHRCECGKQR